jgi:hypothetical protein
MPTARNRILQVKTGIRCSRNLPESARQRAGLNYAAAVTGKYEQTALNTQISRSQDYKTTKLSSALSKQLGATTPKGSISDILTFQFEVTTQEFVVLLVGPGIRVIIFVRLVRPLPRLLIIVFRTEWVGVLHSKTPRARDQPPFPSCRSSDSRRTIDPAAAVLSTNLYAPPIYSRAHYEWRVDSVEGGLIKRLERCQLLPKTKAVGGRQHGLQAACS